MCPLHDPMVDLSDESEGRSWRRKKKKIDGMGGKPARGAGKMYAYR